MKPVLALVGRPNVGKSTLFNRLTQSRDAIVADFAGLTRDRHYGNGRLGRREFIVIDTGGFEPTAESGIYMEMAKQTRQAVAEADVVVFVVDARGGLSAQDHDIADYLRKQKMNATFFVLGSSLQNRVERSSAAEVEALYQGQCVGTQGWQYRSHSHWVDWQSSITRAFTEASTAPLPASSLARIHRRSA